MQSKITRRAVLAGASAVAATAALPAVAAGDERLLALCAEWHRLRDIHGPLWKKATEAYESAESDPEFPPPGSRGKKIREEIDRIWARYGYHDLYSRASDLAEEVREVAEVLFHTPANTDQGVLAKVRVVLRVLREDDDREYDALPEEFAELVEADLERLAGGAS